MAEFDVERLTGISQALASGGMKEALEIDLFDDLAVTVHPKHVESYGAGRFVIRGRLAQAAAQRMDWLCCLWWMVFFRARS